MTAPELLLAALLWCSIAGVAYAYILYPPLIWALSRLLGSDEAPPASDALPRVALIIAAHNEEAVIGSRIQNALQLDYPPDLLEILIVSDGSTDATNTICAAYDGRIRLLALPDRGGKPAALNAAASATTAEILAFSDANTFMRPDSLRRLCARFVNPRIGAVCGRLELRDATTGRNADGIYWRYETFLKRCENRLGALLGANGAIYALRRDCFVPLPAGTLVDDFVLPLLAKLRHNCRIVYDDHAIAHEETAPRVRDEFGRRSRIGAGGLHALRLLAPLLHPRHGWTAFAFFSHKVMRWACPFLMLNALIVSLALAHHPICLRLLAAQLAFYALCSLCALLPLRAPALRPLRLLPMFTGMNLALLVGILRALARPQSGVWSRTPRVAPAAQSS